MEKEKIIEEMRDTLANINETNGIHILGYYPLAEELVKQDYRKVVMCKDCKYFFNEHIKACTYWNGHATTETNYCSCAKMKGE